MPEQEFIPSSPRRTPKKGFGNEHLAKARQISSSDVSTSTELPTELCRTPLEQRLLSPCGGDPGIRSHPVPTQFPSDPGIQSTQLCRVPVPAGLGCPRAALHRERKARRAP